jgi:chitosanase
MDDLQKETAQAIVNIFETGRILGNYGAVTVLKGDNGHLTYGRSQTTLGSGNLYRLLLNYCQQSTTPFAARLQPLLPRFLQKDFTLDTDLAVKELLKQAASDDPMMRAAQDQFFNENYFAPALRAADAAGITQPLGQTVVYDSHIQGGWGVLKPQMPGLNDFGGETAWIAKYVDKRKAWLQSLKPPLPGTVYRMDSFNTLIDAGKWNLALPLTVHGVTITAEALAGDVPAAGAQPRTLRLVSPYLRGDDVKQIQMKLNPGATPDGVYGPFTEALVKKFQAAQTPSVVEDGAGPLTRKALGL